MSMNINLKVLSIPPYISTTWDQISSMHLSENQELTIILKEGSKINIPLLKEEEIQSIFSTHRLFLEEKKEQKLVESKDFFGGFGLRLPALPLATDAALIEPFAANMQHNPEQSDFPPLPPEILNKISSMHLMLGPEIIESLPKAEPDCNCIFCQVMKALRHDDVVKEEDVTIEDLRFKDWEIEEKSDQLYNVKNPLDPSEQYQVFLGSPLGCTCGHKNCEHIRAVLNS